MSDVQVERSDHNNTLNLRISLAYTGGGSIDYFIVSFRRPEGPWAALGNVSATATGDVLVWTAQVVDNRFQDSKIEVQIQVVNSNGHTSNPVNQTEAISKLERIIKYKTPVA